MISLPRKVEQLARRLAARCGIRIVVVCGPDERVAATLADLQAALPPTEFTAEVLEALRRHYRPGVRFAAAFAGWIEELLGRHGLGSEEELDPGLVRALAPARTRRSPSGSTHLPSVSPREEPECQSSMPPTLMSTASAMAAGAHTKVTCSPKYVS